MKESRKEFIIQAHKAACDGWKRKIEEEFPKLFKPQLEVGKWYKAGHYLIYVDKIIGEYASVYGFNGSIWYTSDVFKAINGVYPLILATEVEVKEALVREANKRGLTLGSYYDSLPSKRYTALKRTEIKSYHYNKRENLVYSSFGILFDNGKWAVPLPTMTKEEAEQKLGVIIR